MEKELFSLYIPEMKQFIKTRKGEKLFELYDRKANKIFKDNTHKLVICFFIAHYIKLYVDGIKLTNFKEDINKTEYGVRLYHLL